MRGERQGNNRELLVNHPPLPEGPAVGPGTQNDQKQEFRAETDRILASSVIGNSEALRTLLSYLAEKYVTGEAGKLKEYVIGVEAFAKPSQYDPQDDPSVRILAGKLRHKLEEYYLREGANSPCRIEMPRGHFALKFSPRPAKPPIQDYAALESRVAKWRLIAASLALVAGLSFLAALRWGSFGESKLPVPSDTRIWTPELDRIWSPFIQSRRPILISLGTPLFTKFRGGGFFRSHRINEEAEAAESEQIRQLKEQLGSPYAVPSYAYTGAGEAIGVFLLGRLLEGRAEHFSLRRSSTLTWEEIQNNNVIFVGPPKFNLHLAAMPTEDLFFIRDGTVQNPAPRAGEMRSYPVSWAPNHMELLEDHALILRSHGLHGSGELMSLAAASTEGTWAAVEFVTQPVYARELVRRVVGPAGVLPGSYQVLIRVRFRKQVPVEISYLTHRVLSPEQRLNGSGKSAEQPAP